MPIYGSPTACWRPRALWNAPGYADTGRKLLAQIRRIEVAEAAGVGPVLLPGALGGTCRLQAR